MTKPINLLYYSSAFIANHGGRLHSEAFLKEAKKNKKINEILIYPKPILNADGRKTTNKGFRKTLKNLALFQVLFFYRRNYQSFREILPVLKSNDVDALHIRLDSNFLIIKKLRQLFPELIITTEVNASPFDENFKNIGFLKHFKKMEQSSLEKADANFFVSGYLRKSIMKKVMKTRDFVVHNGVALDMFKPNPVKRERDVITLGYVGTIDYHKNLKILIDAFDKVHHHNSKKIKLLIIGDGPMFNELKLYSKEKKLSKAIEFTGWVAHKNIVKHLYRMDIAVHHAANPYMSPLKIFEYMAVGLPVIGPDIPAVREILTDGEDILLVKNDVDDITDKMGYLINNINKRESISNAGKEKIRTQFGWCNNVDSILSVIQNKYNENN